MTVGLFDDALAWLRATYRSHGFGVERDIVWTVYKRMVATARDQPDAMKVWTDYPVERGPRRGFG